MPPLARALRYFGIFVKPNVYVYKSEETRVYYVYIARLIVFTTSTPISGVGKDARARAGREGRGRERGLRRKEAYANGEMQSRNCEDGRSVDLKKIVKGDSIGNPFVIGDER